MNNALHAETPVKSTIAKIASAALALVAAVWFIRGQVGAVTARMDTIDARLTSIEKFIRNEAVTQSQAERYAAVFRWENRALGVSVPDPDTYRDKPKS